MSKNGYFRIIISNNDFKDFYIGNRILVNSLSELDTMIVNDRYNCSKILCIHIDNAIDKTELELALYRFADKLQEAGAIGDYCIHPMGESFEGSRILFPDVFSDDEKIRQRRYVINYANTK